MTERRLRLITAIGLIVGVTLMPVSAGAAQQTAEPALLSLAWWWEDYQGEELDIGGNKVVVETPNPFCPSTPGSTGAVPGGCAEGRLPIEIRGGDYETPVMLSAVGFDLSVLTPGSEVSRFTATFLEAEAGCYDEDGDGEFRPDEAGGDHCEQTDPVNVEGHNLKACLVNEIFGDAEGRPYEEVPRYRCSDTDPIAERKEIKTVDEDPAQDADGVDHVWTFDLTPFAQQWAQEFTVSTAIMIVGEEPEETNSQDSWRVVLAGPKAFKGVRTKLVYEPGEIVLPPPPPPAVGGTTGTGFGTTTDSGSGSFGFPSSGTDAGSAGVSSEAPASEEVAPSAAPGTELAADDLTPQGMPGYVVLALLAGLVGFVLVRQAVIESATGIRPNGVLAKIHALNAERRGAPALDAAEPSGFAAGLSSIGRNIAAPFKKLSSFKKG